MGTGFKSVKLLRAASAAQLSVRLIALWKLFKHPQAPRSAKLVTIVVLAYVLSPIDLFPDFIPLLGQLDDLLLVLLGVALVVRLTPKPLWEACLQEARVAAEKLPRLWWGAAAVLLLWALMLALFVGWLIRLARA